MSTLSSPRLRASFGIMTAVVALSALSGCARLYSDKPVPHAPLPQDVHAEQTKVITDNVNGQSLPERFAREVEKSPVASATRLQALIASPKLDALLARMQTNDLELLIARKQLAFANTQNDVAQFDILPSLNAGLSGGIVSRQQTDPVRQISLKLSSRWEIDVWGIVRDQIRSGDVDIVLQKIALHDAEQSLMLKGIRAWLNAIVQKQLLVIAKDELALQQRFVTAIKQRVQAGLIEASEYDNAKRQLTNVRRKIERQTREIATAMRQLTQLSNQFRAEELDELVPSALPQLGTLNTESTPLDVLTRRTDMKKAYWQLIKADLGARIAYYNQFPRFTLTASTQSGGQAGGKSLASLLDLSKITAQLASNLARELIGDDDAVVKAEQQKLNADVHYLRYQQVMLAAFHEVEQALSNYRESAAAIGQAKADLRNAEVDEKRVREKYFAGLSDYLQQQNAQSAIFSAKRGLLQAHHAQLVRRVELAKVLGYAY